MDGELVRQRHDPAQLDRVERAGGKIEDHVPAVQQQPDVRRQQRAEHRPGDRPGGGGVGAEGGEASVPIVGKLPSENQVAGASPPPLSDAGPSDASRRRSWRTSTFHTTGRSPDAIVGTASDGGAFGGGPPAAAPTRRPPGSRRARPGPASWARGPVAAHQRRGIHRLWNGAGGSPPAARAKP